jgi:hypothetical protein
MAYNAPHDLITFQIHKLVIMYHKNNPCEWNMIMWLPQKPLFLQNLQVHFGDRWCIIMHSFNINNQWIFWLPMACCLNITNTTHVMSCLVEVGKSSSGWVSWTLIVFMVGHEEKFIKRLFSKKLTQYQKTQTSHEMFTNLPNLCNNFLKNNSRLHNPLGKVGW